MAIQYVYPSSSDSEINVYASALRNALLFDPDAANDRSWMSEWLSEKQAAARTYAGADLKLETPERAFAHLALGNKAELPRYVQNAASPEAPVELRTNRDRLGYTLANARFDAEMRFAQLTVLKRGARIARQVLGQDPVHDNDGNELSGTAARNARIALLNHWYCLIVDTRLMDGVALGVRRKTLIEGWVAAEKATLASDLKTLREELTDSLDRDIEARCAFLFDIPCGEPANTWQTKAWYALARERQKFRYASAVAATGGEIEAASAAAVAAVAATGVEHAPSWQDEHGEPFHGGDASSTYAYETGASKWKLDLHAFSSGKVAEGPPRKRAVTYGPCWAEPFENDDFEIVPWTPGTAIANDLYIRVQRKGNGHPSAGIHEFKLTARNYNGPTVLAVTVTVPEPPQ